MATIAARLEAIELALDRIAKALELKLETPRPAPGAWPWTVPCEAVAHVHEWESWSDTWGTRSRCRSCGETIGEAHDHEHIWGDPDTAGYQRCFCGAGQYDDTKRAS